MRFAEKKIILKDGREGLLTPTSVEYAAEMLDYLKITAAETPFLLRYPDEVKMTVEEEEKILKYLLESDRTVMMMGLVEGKIAGNCSLNPVSDKRRVKHRASMAIALKKEYWGLGIGTEMIKYLTTLAGENGFEQIELEVVEGNEQAKRLYEKCGFVETGRHVRAMKYDDGTYRDEWIMSKIL